jgi:hypothetical protein
MRHACNMVLQAIVFAAEYRRQRDNKSASQRDQCVPSGCGSSRLRGNVLTPEVMRLPAASHLLASRFARNLAHSRSYGEASLAGACGEGAGFPGSSRRLVGNGRIGGSGCRPGDTWRGDRRAEDRNQGRAIEMAQYAEQLGHHGAFKIPQALDQLGGRLSGGSGGGSGSAGAAFTARPLPAHSAASCASRFILRSVVDSVMT